MGKKTTVGIYVDEQVVKTVKELGFNINNSPKTALKKQ